MKATVVFRKGHQQTFGSRVATGLRRHGVEVLETQDHRDVTGEFVVCWGWRNGLKHIDNRPVLVMERGYIGDRFHWTSLGWNGLNGRANFCNQTPSQHRFRWEMKDWKKPGGYWLVMGQVSGDMSLSEVDYPGWLREMERLPGDVRYRPHPKGQVDDVRLPVVSGPLEDALAGADRVLTMNSNSAVDAVLAGVPAVTFDHGSMAWDVTSHDPSIRYQCDRYQWANKLAHCQWSPDELERGDFWPQLREGLCAAA